MIVRIAAIIALLITGSAPIASADLVDAVDIWIRPSNTGIQVSGNQNWGIISVDEDGNIRITNSISTKRIMKNPKQTKKPRINIGIGNN